MLDPLLYRPIHRIPVTTIKQKVSEATGIPLSLMLLKNKVTTSRKREYVTARQISMKLCREYTIKSLAYIGNEHGGRDHATVLHAIKTINNFIDTKDKLILDWYYKSKDALKLWDLNNNSRYNKPIGKAKTALIKSWIKHNVPLFIREHRLKTYGMYCSKCGQLLNKL